MFFLGWRVESELVNAETDEGLSLGSVGASGPHECCHRGSAAGWEAGCGPHACSSSQRHASRASVPLLHTVWVELQPLSEIWSVSEVSFTFHISLDQKLLNHLQYSLYMIYIWLSFLKRREINILGKNIPGFLYLMQVNGAKCRPRWTFVVKLYVHF